MKIFERTSIASPDSTYDLHRIAFGKAGVISLNITLSKFKNWLYSQYAGYFLLQSGNFNNLANKETCRTNLDVYQKSDAYTKTETNLKFNAIKTKAGMRVRFFGNISFSNPPTKYSGDLDIVSVENRTVLGNLQKVLTMSSSMTAPGLDPNDKNASYILICAARSATLGAGDWYEAHPASHFKYLDDLLEIPIGYTQTAGTISHVDILIISK